MGKPTEEELETALKYAREMREQGEDMFFIGKSLLNLHYRLKLLEDVMHKANLYLHSGMGATEHAELVKAIEMAEESEKAPDEEEHDIHPW